MDNSVEKVEKLKNLHKKGQILKKAGGICRILQRKGASVLICCEKFVVLAKIGPFPRLKKNAQAHIMNEDTNEPERENCSR